MNYIYLKSNSSRVIVVALLSAIVLSMFVANRLAHSAEPDIKSKLSMPEASTSAAIADQFGKLPLRFEANQGQTDRQVKFLSRGPGYDLFLTSTTAVLRLRRSQSPPIDKFAAPPAKADSSDSVREAFVLRLKMIGANPGASTEGRDELPGKVNYLIGNDPEQWHANVPTYAKVHYQEIYPGVDKVYYGNQRQLEYDFVVAPHADPRVVKFQVEGAQGLRVDSKGDLVITADHSEVKLRKPVIYQTTEQGERNEVSGSYALKGSEVSFKVENYDATKTLVIDPVLSYSTYFGPAAQAVAIAVDASGNAYLTGSALFGNFPTTVGALKTDGSQDVPDGFVTKMNATGTALVYSTYLGGRGNDFGNSIVVDSSGNALVTGDTLSANFPTVNPIRSSTSNFFQTADAGGHWSGQFVGPPSGVVNVLVVDPLTPSTIYAGMGLNGGGGVYKSTDGGTNWVGLNTGLTNANCPALVIDPTTPSTLYASLNPNNPPGAGLYKSVDAGATWTQLTNGLNGITVSALAIDPLSPSTVYAGASFLGLYKSTNAGASWTNSSTGINFGGIASIAVDPANSAIVYASAGGGGVFKTSNGAANWGQVNTGLTSTTVRVLKIDSASNVYAGTASGGLFKSTNGGGNWSPLNNGLPTFNTVSSLALNSNGSTIFMGNQAGRIYKSIDSGANWTISYETLTGTTFNSLVINPTNSSVLYAGATIRFDPLSDHEAFIAKLNPTGSALVYSTYLGGDKDDTGRGVAVDSAGNAYVTGQTSSPTFPLAAAFQSTLKGTSDAFVTAMSPAGALVYSTFLGGDSVETANAIATDGGGNAYVTGSTSSANFPIANAFQPTLAGGDAFATKFSNAGALAYSTYLGGTGSETGYGIAADSSGNAYITGATNSTNFPTLNPILTTNLGGFVTKLNNLGSGLVYSTYSGNSRAIAVDSSENAYVTGFTNSLDFPVVAGALQTKSPFYKSSNSGGNWGNDNYGLKGSGITCLAIDPALPSTLYAGTGSGGVYKSTDGGNNWSAINSGLGSLRMTDIVVDPLTPANLFAASYDSFASSTNGVYKSINGGNSWTRVVSGMSNTSVVVLAIDPLTPATLYAASSGGPIYKTTNAAASWSPAGTPSISFPVSLAIDPSTPTTVYAASDVSNGGIFKSIDAGGTWQQVGLSQIGNFGKFVAVKPLAPSTVYASSNTGLFKSIDSGVNWTLINSQYAFSKVVFDPVNSTTIYLLTTSQGILRSTDDGQSWTPINKGFKSTSAIALKIDPVNPLRLYAATATSGDNDAFVSKINPSGSAFVYSTLLGGTPAPGDSSGLNDEGYGIAVDLSGNAYVTGSTRALDFPVTPDSYLPVPVGTSFVSKLAMSYLIGGQVLDGSSAPVSGAEVTLSDGGSQRSVITGSDGSYQFSQLREGGSFTVSAAKPHFTMTPPSQTFNNLNSNQTLNFVATATGDPFYSISGTVTNNSIGLSGVTVTLAGSQSGVRTTDSNGNYSFTVAGGGSYTVTPSLLGFSFTPPNQTFNTLSADQSANFTATRQSFVVTTASEHGTGSLRQAMLDANATPGTDTIVFNIPGAGVQTINLLLALPEITDPVVIDATTQPGYAGAPLVELNGALVGSNSAGFRITAGGSTIRGFVINRFLSAGFGAIFISTNGSNIIQANYLGLNSTGTVASANQYGIIISNSSNNLIGGTTPAARNVISGSGFAGISLAGSSNQITGNFIGTNASGTAAVGNLNNGIEVTGSSATNIIGGTTPGGGNLISGNQRGISTNSSGVLIQGNLIGTDVSGTLAIGNGVGIQSSVANTIIGGTAPGARNIISGNTNTGVIIAGAGSRLEGNFVGTDITGTAALGNGGSGVAASNGALIGGTTPAARNVISCNGGNGGFGNVSLEPNSTGATVQGNYIGTDVTGNVALTNPLSGISVSGSNNQIGGLVPGAQNVISGNSGGIRVGGSILPGPTGNTIQGNLIGLNALGTAALPNALGGIVVNDSANNIIGGNQIGAANRISFNAGPGVNVSSGSTGNKVLGNSIFSNIGLGIDLTPIGVTANDVADADTGANNLQNFPLLTLVSANGGGTAIQGTLNSKPNTVFQIDFYSNSACDPSGNGEGGTFFDTTSVTTDANGNATINFASSNALSSGKVLTATATDPTGNTSEFSPCDATNLAGAVEFNTASYNVREEVGSALITVLRVGGSKGTLSVAYSSADVTATAGSDYTAVSGTLVFADGEISKTFSIPIADDGITEAPETARLALTAPDLQTLGSIASATLTILPNDTPLVLDINQVNVPESNGGAPTTAVVTVSLSAGTSQTVTANFSTASDSAASGADFTPVSGTVNFSAGVTTQTISIPIINDSLDELDERFRVNLTNVTNASAGNTGFVFIIDDDPLPSVSISDVFVTEGNSGTVSAVFNVSLAVPSGRSVFVSYQTANGTATAGSDYVSRTASVTIPTGETVRTISITVNGDTTVEPDETFLVNITSATSAIVADSQGVGTIVNDDGPGGSLGFSQTNYSVNEGAGNATITVNRTGGTAGEARVDYATSNGTATAGQDYTAASGTLIFPNGVTSQTFNVAITDDPSLEAGETINLALTNAAGNGSLGTPASAVLTIGDDDPIGGYIRFSSANFNTTESSGSTTITVERVGDTGQAIAVDYATAEDGSTTVVCATANGIASSRCDFTTALGTLQFAAGESSKTFLVLISQDNYVEGPETLALTLSNLTGGAAFASPSTATLTIADDATEPSANPIDTADVFVRQHYHDFLNREPDAAGLAFWSNQITECQQPGATCNADVRRINVSAAFFLSIEFQQTGYLVERLYKTAYGDAVGTSNFGPPHQLPVPVVRFSEFLPDTQQIGKGVIVGEPGWEQQLQQNKLAFVLDFVSRGRFATAYPNTMTPAEFVDALYLKAGVTPSDTERTSVINEFGGAATSADTGARARALGRVAENPTLAAQEKNKAFVLMQYFGYLRRNPNDPQDTDYSGYDFWLTKLNEFNGNFVNAEMVKAFLVASEYRQRFGP